MRSDYYDPVSWEPLRPLTKPRKKRKKRGTLIFAVTLALLLAGAAGAGISAYLAAPPDLPYDGEEEEPLSATTIQRLQPPGEGTLYLEEGPGETLDPTEIYARVSPAVVTVTAVDDFGMGGEGTGVIFDESGYLITNHHVIDGNSLAFVTLSNGREYPAYLIGMDEQTDLAVLKISLTGLTTAKFGSDSILKVGEPAYALGNPLGSQFSGSMTDGIISAIDRSVEVGGYEMSLLQTTAALNQGNSGGALLDSRGRVVGITNMKMMSSQSTVEGLGFAIPATTVAQVVNDLMSYGHVTGRPMLGITVQPHRTGNGVTAGLDVVEVEEKSDAWAKGIRPGDRLLTANGMPLMYNDDLLREKEGLAAGESVRLRWKSGDTGEEIEDDIFLVEQYELEEN